MIMTSLNWWELIMEKLKRYNQKLHIIYPVFHQTASWGIFLSNFIFNSLLMRFPISGERVSISSYLTGNFRNHLVGILGGAIWSLGMSFSILASEKAGPAISYGLGQGATVIAALWGIYVWKEFKNSSATVFRILQVMLALYIIGLMIIIFSR